MRATISAENTVLTIDITDQALRSWLKSTRRTLQQLRCPLCGQRARLQREFMTCSNPDCRWGCLIDDAIYTADLLDVALQYPTASFTRTPPDVNRPHSEAPGGVKLFIDEYYLFYEARHGQ